MAQVPHADEGLICPLHREDMSKVCHRCPLWILVRGKHPQSNQDVDSWNCALAWMPILTIENSQQQRATAATVASFRDEVVKANTANAEAFAALVAPKNDQKFIGR